MSSFSRPGAFDLSALKQPAPSTPGPPRPGTGGSFVIDASEQTFQTDVVEASMRYVVVLSLWSPRAAQSASFNATLAAVTNSYAGRILLAQIDVDASPQIAQAVGAQGVPFVLGLIKGQPVPLFQGTVDEPEVRRFFDELLKVAESNGLTGTAAPAGVPAEPADAVESEPKDDPRFAEADEALGAGDFEAAIAAYEKLLAQNPADTESSERLAGVRLMHRTSGADLSAARAAAADLPDDLDAQLLVADLDVSGGHVEDAFTRLIDLVRRTTGDDKERVRQRVLELFVVVGADDPRVAPARRALASALF